MGGAWRLFGFVEEPEEGVVVDVEGVGLVEDVASLGIPAKRSRQQISRKYKGIEEMSSMRA